MFFQRLSFLVLLLSLLTGCASPDAVPAADVVLWTVRGVEESAARSAAEVYAVKRGVQVRVEGFGQEAYLDRASAGLLAGLAEPDLLLLPGDSLVYWAGYHALRPLSPVEEAELGPWLAALEVKGVLYGVPLQPEVEVLWYRADLLAGAGLEAPRTWDEFRAAAMKLNHPPQMYGAALAGSGLDAGTTFAAVLAGFGGQAVGSGSTVRLAEAPALQALDFYAGLRLRDGVTPPAAEDATRAAVQDALASGKAALGIAPLSAGSRLRDCSASPNACKDGLPLLEWAWLPGLDENEASGSLSALVIPLRAAHPALAEEFARWLCSEAGAAAWAQGGGTPANPRVLETLGHEGMALARVETLYQVFPPTGSYEKMWKAAHSAVHAAVAGLETPDTALQNAAAEMEKLLRKEDN